MTGRTAAASASPLGEAALARIADAVGRAEETTSAEIVVLVAARAGRYRSGTLLAALLAGLALPWPLIAATAWSAAGIALAQACIVLAILGLGLDDRLRLALTPARIRRAQAREAAHRAFRARGLARTRGRSGLLIHLCLAERHAEIVADTGILAKVGPERWNAALALLFAGLARGETEAGLVAAVEAIGRILAEVLPAGPGDTDELPNRVIVTG